MSERERALVLRSPTDFEKVEILSHDIAKHFRLDSQTFKDLTTFGQINYCILRLDNAFKKPNRSEVTVIIDPLEDDENKKEIYIKRSQYEPTRKKLTHHAFEIYFGFLRQNEDTKQAASVVLGLINDIFSERAN